MGGGICIKIVITAGPTIEPIDPVRFISNRSTGYMGYKLAEEASKRGHLVTLVSGPVKLIPPKVKKFISVETADYLLQVLKKEVKKTDCLIMCAAVGDFRAKKIVKSKIKRKQRLQIELIPNKDILRELVSYKKSNLFIGFSLETGSLIANSYKKLKDKNLDIIVANQIKKGCNIFGDNKLTGCIIDKDGKRQYFKQKTKSFIAHVLLDKISKLWYLNR